MRALMVVLCASILLAGVFTMSYGQPPDDLSKVKPGKGMVKVIQAGGLRAQVLPLYTTVDDPNFHLTSAGGELDGVGMLLIKANDGFTYGCSGSLMSTGIHVLAAAHCVTDSNGVVNVVSGTVTFRGDVGDYTIGFDKSGVVVHSSWNGDVIKGNDVAVIQLLGLAPVEITRYDIDRDTSNDLKANNEKDGFGISGFGAIGADRTTYPFGTARNGVNLYDDYADTMLKALRLKPGKQFVPGSQLQYDFDNGKSANDAFGYFFNNHHLGLGNNEVGSAPGDSGGPTYTRDSTNKLVVTGITSYGIRLQYVTGGTSDVDSQLNSSFGEFAGDTSVAFYSSFIDSVLSGSGSGGGGSSCTPGHQKRGLC